MESESQSRRHKQMIINLGRLLKAEDLNKLKFLCKDVIPTNQREKISTTEDLFEVLEQRGKVSPRDQTYLKQLLQDGLLGRTDVLAVVVDYERNVVSSPDIDAVRFSRLQIEDFNREIQFLKDNLGCEYRTFLRLLGVTDNHIERIELDNLRNVREVIYQCIRLWMDDHRDWQREQLVEAVVNVFKRMKYNDLALKFEAGEFD